MEVTMEQLYQEIKELRKDVELIKATLDPDMVMTKGEEKQFKQALQEFKKGKTTSLADLQAELDL